MAHIDGLTVVAPALRDFLARAMARPRTVMYLNAHVFNLASADSRVMRALRSADMVYCDGAGIQIGARLLRQTLRRRLTSVDWIDAFAQACVARRRSLYLLGGRPGIASRAAALLRRRHPGLLVAGTHHGYFAKHGSDTTSVIRRVNAGTVDILIVGFGSPLQEMWVHANRARLDVPTVWCVGAMMDFITGSVPRAPAWMRERKLEWLYRLGVEPRRMWRRYLLGNVFFLGRMLRRRWDIETKRSQRTPDEDRHRLSAA